VHLRPSGLILDVKNDAPGRKRLNRFMKDNNVVLTVIEATGKCHRAALRPLHDAGHAVAVVNPGRSRAFAESIGVLAKTDSADAGVLALMAETLKLAPTSPSSRTLETLQELVHFRQGIIADRVAMQNRRGEATCGVMQDRLDDMVKVATTAEKKVDKEIMKVIATDEAMLRRMEILTAIPGIAFVSAAPMIADLPELGQGDDKAVAALVGVAPFAADSGGSRGKRRIRGGRKPLRDTLDMAARAACNSNPDMKRFHDRLKAAGKEWKVIATAVIGKLLIPALAIPSFFR
jgi:transposase